MKAIRIISLVAASIVYAETPGEMFNRDGNDLARSGKLQEAISLYDRAIAIEPDYDEPYYNRGKAKLMLRDYASAIADFDIAIKLAPNKADAFNNRGIAKKKSGDISGAISDYTKALALDPHQFRIYYNRGVARYEAGDKARAIEDFQTAADHKITEAIDALRKIQSFHR